jgi:hypothetical protein
MDPKTDHSAITEISDSLASKLYFHGHPINRGEAKALGLRVTVPGVEEEQLIWDLYQDFAAEMRIEEEFQPLIEFMNAVDNIPAGQPPVDVDLDPVIG